MDRKVWLPSGGSLVIDRTEAMTVVDVNTGKFVGSGGNLEETVTKNNLEAAEEIVRQLRLRDIGGIIVIDFIDMVLESNRDLVVRRLLECLGRDRTKHQVAEVTSLGLVQMTRKRVGSGLIEVFSEHVRALRRPRHHRALRADRPRRQRADAGGGAGRRQLGSAAGAASGRGTARVRLGRSGSGGTGRRRCRSPTSTATPSRPDRRPDRGGGARRSPAQREADAAGDGTSTTPTQRAAEAEHATRDRVDRAPAVGRRRRSPTSVRSTAARTPRVGRVAVVALGPEADGRRCRSAVEPDAGRSRAGRRGAQVESPGRRGRRKRGRVVAPAGPPAARGCASAPRGDARWPSRVPAQGADPVSLVQRLTGATGSLDPSVRPPSSMSRVVHGDDDRPVSRRRCP